MRVRIFKLRSERRGQHVYTTVFSGWEGQTLANTGQLIQNIGEWQDFGATLLLGAKQTSGRVKVVTEGDEQVVKEEASV